MSSNWPYPELITLESLKAELDDLRGRIGSPRDPHPTGGGATVAASHVNAIHNEVAWFKSKVAMHKTDCLLVESDLEDVNSEVIALKSVVAAMKASIAGGDPAPSQLGEALDTAIEHLVRVDFRLNRLLPRATGMHGRMPIMERNLSALEKEVNVLMNHLGMSADGR